MFSLKRELERKNYVALHKFCDSGDASREETPALCEAVPFWLGTSRDGLELDHRRALLVTAEWMADLYNHNLHSREAARDAIQRYNDHIDRCNRAIEAGESGCSMLNDSAADMEALQAELQRVGGELTRVKRENEIIQEQLRSKTTLVTEMSLRLDALGNKRNRDAQGTDVHGANHDLVKHINDLQEQLYAERQKNRQLKGA